MTEILTGIITMREPCRNCGHSEGEWRLINGQLPVYCSECGVHARYNAPHVAAGLKPNTASNRPTLSASRRTRIINRDCGRCVLCGDADAELHVGHIVSRSDGIAAGFDPGIIDRIIDSDDNLAAMCANCNLGLGSSTLSPGTYLAIVAVRDHERMQP